MPALKDKLLKNSLANSVSKSPIFWGSFGILKTKYGLVYDQEQGKIQKIKDIEIAETGYFTITLNGVEQTRFDFEIKDQERVAQLVLAPVVQADFELVEELSDTARGAGGFGSTGR